MLSCRFFLWYKKNKKLIVFTDMVKENGFLTVDQNHKVYYERIGQTNAPTLLFLHDGPV